MAPSEAGMLVSVSVFPATFDRRLKPRLTFGPAAELTFFLQVTETDILASEGALVVRNS